MVTSVLIDETSLQAPPPVGKRYQLLDKRLDDRAPGSIRVYLIG